MRPSQRQGTSLSTASAIPMHDSSVSSPTWQTQFAESTHSSDSSTLRGPSISDKLIHSLAKAEQGLPLPVAPAITNQLEPTIPEDMQRTKRRPQVPRKTQETTLKAGKLTDQLRRRTVQDWNYAVHPSGALYFRQRRGFFEILTDTDLNVDRNLDEINAKAASLLDLASRYQIHPDQAPSTSKSDETPITLVLELSTARDKAGSCQYYFVDHAERLIFWVHDRPDGWVSKTLCGELRHASEGSHIRHAVEAQYWLHCERYANNIRLTPEHIHELREILIHANADAVLTETSVVPFARADLEKMLLFVCQIEDHAGRDCDHSHSMSVVARMMRLFAHSRFINFHGSPYARLDADQSLYGSSERPNSFFFIPLNLLLLCAPVAHLTVLQDIYVDRLINASRWGGFVNNLKEEWNGFSIYSTVMLAVDISFLAVPTGISRAVSTAIYASTLAALGALVVSVFLLGQIRGLEIDSVEEGAAYMASKTSSFFGAELLAIVLSLPYAFLVWGMIAFGIALTIVIFKATEGAAKAIVVTVWTIVVILTSVPLWLGRGRRSVKSW
ncbi:hypothetical protein HYDPIDRAFT_112090 [Hydnomerulius pinastri MD-312]|uniref:Uncharacterized protein n=1 Tax=Hydnomerulius pinastri MD-312 TaxID=994086 RepID=A0A0C9WFG1_9AGAM|nr:hypothetical protein HYDPIDRAFT_112090 [Hydnomerulius pinastri MD-312]